MISLEIIVPGDTKDIVAINKDGRCACRNYLSIIDRKTRVKMISVMALMADNGYIRNKRKFRKLRDGIYEFKADTNNHLARIFCFFHSSYVICTHGSEKPTKKQLDIEISKGKKIRDDYLSQRR